MPDVVLRCRQAEAMKWMDGQHAYMLVAEDRLTWKQVAARAGEPMGTMASRAKRWALASGATWPPRCKGGTRAETASTMRAMREAVDAGESWADVAARHGYASAGSAKAAECAWRRKRQGEEA